MERETRDIVEIIETLIEIRNDLVYWLNEAIILKEEEASDLVGYSDDIIGIVEEFERKCDGKD